MGVEYIQTKVPYEELVAMQAGGGISTYEASSVGTITAGYWINWTREGGFSGTQGWWPEGTYYVDLEGIEATINLDGTNGPAVGKTQEEIMNEIDRESTLNNLFSEWVTSDTVKLYFAAAMASVGCANRVN